MVGHPGGDRLPLLYPHLLGFPLQLQLMSDRSFPFPALGLVHVDNVVTARRPILVGSPLDVRVHAEPVRAHPKGRVVDLVTVVTQDGEQVWTEASSYLRRGRASTGPDGATPAVAADAPDTPVDEPVDDETPALHQAALWRLGGDLGRRYAGVSGDVNPIHLHPWTARALGFPRAIAHGMWTAAATVAALDGRLPDAVQYQVSFRRPILLPSTVRLFTAVTPDGAHAEVRGRDGSDTVHLTATLTPAP